MKTKLLCLVLCIVMLATALASCGEKTGEQLMNDIGEEGSKGAVTLAMYLMAEEKVGAEQEARIEAAVNEIVDTHKVKLDLVYLTPDEYYTRLDANLARMKKYYDGKEFLNKTTEAPVYTDDNGLPTTYYPPIEPFQVDIFYFSGYDRYNTYKKAGYLAKFDDQITSGASALRSDVSSILFENTFALNGQYDMMPINAEVSEYTYMLLNKDVLAKTQYAAKDIQSLVDKDCQDLLAMVDKSLGEYVPLYSSTGELNFSDVKFFGTDENGYASDDFSILAGTYDSAWQNGAEGSYPEMSAVNATKDNGSGTVKEQISILKGYEFKGYYATEAESNKPFAVGYVTGTPADVEAYAEDYEIVVLEAPTLKTESLYDGAFAITAQSGNIAKSAKILAELYTNEEFANIIAHGIENENYVWTNSDYLDANDNPFRVIKKQVKDDKYTYAMDPYKCGNVLICHTTTDGNPNAPKYMLAQNGAAKTDIIFGYTPYGNADKELMAKINAASAEIYDRIKKASNEAELTVVLEDLDALCKSEDVKTALTAENGVYANYDKWLVAKGLKPAAPAETK